MSPKAYASAANIGSKIGDASFSFRRRAENKTSYGEWFLAETHIPVSQYEKFAEQVNLETFNLTASNAPLRVRPGAEGWHPLDLRSVTFTPAKQLGRRML